MSKARWRIPKVGEKRQFYGRTWTGVSTEQFIDEFDCYLHWYNEGRIKMSPWRKESDGIQAKPWVCMNQSRKTSAPPVGEVSAGLDNILSVRTLACRSALVVRSHTGIPDQFGRTVTNPAGVDVTPAVASELGLGYLQIARDVGEMPWAFVNCLRF